MFTVDATFTHLSARREQVLALIHSLNAISVKVPGFPTSPAMGYVVGWDASNGNASAAIYLYFSAQKQSVTYLCDPRTFPISELPEVTAEAYEFLESMGFMLDDTAYGTRTPEEQAALMERTPVFHADLGRYHAQQSGDDLPEAELEALPEAELEALEPEELATESAAAPAPPQAQASAEPSERSRALGRLLMSF